MSVNEGTKVIISAIGACKQKATKQTPTVNKAACPTQYYQLLLTPIFITWTGSCVWT